MLTAALEAQLQAIFKEEIENALLGLENGTPDLVDALLATLQDAAGLGVDAVVEQLEHMGLGVDWALPNQAAREWARQYTYGLVHDINTTSRDVLQKEIAQWLASGEHLDVLRDTLAPYFGERRAELIAMTETTRAYAEGNIATWQAGGLADRRPEKAPPAHVNCRCNLSIEEQADGSWAFVWNTANDERVCPICGDLHNQPVGLAKEAPEAR